LVERFPTRLEKLPQVLRGDFFDSHCRFSERAAGGISLNFFTLSTVFTDFARRVFVYIVPNVWNSLPLESKSSTSYQTFKHRLKTHLLSSSY